MFCKEYGVPGMILYILVICSMYNSGESLGHITSHESEFFSVDVGLHNTGCHLTPFLFMDRISMYGQGMEGVVRMSYLLFADDVILLA